jgi:hypothetical protein
MQHSKVFPQFKNIHKGEEAVLVATGPTMLHYEPLQKAIHIGVNTAYKRLKLELKYWFALDIVPINDCITEIQKTEFIKFFGQGHLPYPTSYYDRGRHIPDYIIENSQNAYRYYFNLKDFSTINIDIETQPLPDLGSCVYSAAYFAIYTGMKKLYLVGCDCASNGYFNKREQEQHFNTRNLIKHWKIFKRYVSAFHPDVEIISINPIGLRGIFKDIYTEKYAMENFNEGEIKNIEIIRGESII